MADIKWIKLKVGMFNDDRIKVIQAMPEGDALIVIWIRMLILAGISNAEGYLMISENLPYTEDMLSTIFGKPLSVIRLALKTFETFGMVEVCSEGIFITDFAAEQGEKMQDIREYNRIKKAESRERAKQKRLEMSLAGQNDSQENVIDKSMTSQGNMSTCQGTDIDKDIDIIKNNNIPQNPGDLGGKSERLDYERIAALYNTTCKDLPKVRGLSDERKRKIKTLLNSLNKAKVLMELGPYERLEYIFRLADESDFLSGRMQSLSLMSKISMTRRRIQGWIEEYGEDGVYVSFSGGKDSTVLLHLVRQDYPDIKAAFVDTGLEYPEIRQFVRTFSNVDILKPKMNFRQVIENYGYPFISKEVPEVVDYARKYKRLLEEKNSESATSENETVCGYWGMADLLGIDRRTDKNNIQYNLLKKGIMPKEPVRYQMLCGTFKHKEKGVQTDEVSQMYNKERYKFFLDAPFEISAMCCKVMKKQPTKEYAKKSNRKAMTAQMACESKLRTTHWLKNGCNGFDMKRPISNPMAFWTEQDVLQYIVMYEDSLIDWRIREIEKLHGCKIDKIIDTKTGLYAFKTDSLTPIASVYGDVVLDYEKMGLIPGQMEIDFGYPREKPLKTTGCERTGCMFCGYGCHLEKTPNRFEKMKETHPKQYDYIMRPIDEGGLGYKEIIDWINENGNMDIKY